MRRVQLTPTPGDVVPQLLQPVLPREPPSAHARPQCAQHEPFFGGKTLLDLDGTLVVGKKGFELREIEVFVIQPSVKVEDDPADVETAGTLRKHFASRDVVDQALAGLGGRDDVVVVHQRLCLKRCPTGVLARPGNQLSASAGHSLPDLRKVDVKTDGHANHAEVRRVHGHFLSPADGRLRLQLQLEREDLVVHTRDGSLSVDENSGVQPPGSIGPVDRTDNPAAVLPCEGRHCRDRGSVQRLRLVSLLTEPGLGKHDEVDPARSLLLDQSGNCLEAKPKLADFAQVFRNQLRRGTS